LVIATRGFY
jgi:hypothetical protein